MLILQLTVVVLIGYAATARNPSKPSNSKLGLRIHKAHQDLHNVIVAHQKEVTPDTNLKDPMYMKLFPIYPREMLKFLSLSMMVFNYTLSLKSIISPVSDVLDRVHLHHDSRYQRRSYCHQLWC